MRKIILLFSLFYFGFYLQAAQGPGDEELATADALFKKRDYKEAIIYYKKALSSTKNPEIQFRIGECYRLCYEYKNAEATYLLVTQSKEFPPIALLHYGNILRNNGKYDEAKEILSKYKKMNPDPLVETAIRSCDWAKQQVLKKSQLEPSLLSIKTGGKSYGVALYKNGLVMSTPIEDEVGDTKNKKYEMSYVEVKGSFFGKPQRLSGNIDATLYQGSPSMPSNQKYLYFTQNFSADAFIKEKEKGKNKGNKNVLWIYRASNVKDDWKDVQPLKFNDNNYSCTTPFVTADGTKLYFSSNKEGGSGGYDLYVCNGSSDGLWDEPVNLGTDVNSVGDDMFPFVAGDSVLYFSSNGQLGYGGLDVYKASFLKNKKITKPQNLGNGINSSKDDFGLVLYNKGKSGYLSSNREGENGGDRIYSIAKGIRYMSASGKVVDEVNPSQGIQGATIEFLNDSNSVTELKNTNTTGDFKVKLDEEYGYTAIVYAPGYDTLKIKFNTDTTKLRLIKLKPSAFNATASIVDQPTRNAVKNVSVKLYEDGKVIKEWVSPDGKLDLKDLKKGKKYKVELSAEDYDPITYDVQAGKNDYYLKPTPKKDIVFTFNNIYFDKSQATLKEESKVVLDQLQQYLTEEKRILKVELSAHTDSRGSDVSNLSLSNARAKSCLDYLVGKGLAAQRLAPKGYGETQPKNQCTEGVTCTEEEHSINRRVEIKILEVK